MRAQFHDNKATTHEQHEIRKKVTYLDRIDKDMHVRYSFIYQNNLLVKGNQNRKEWTYSGKLYV